MAGEHRHPHTGSADREIGKPENLATLVSQLLILVGLPGPVIDQRPGQRKDVECDGGDVLVRRREVQRAAVMDELFGMVDGGARLGDQFLHPGNPTAGDRLIGGGDDPHQTGLVMQRFEYRHGHHGGAVRIRDDALGQGLAADVAVEVDLADHQRNVRILAPRRRVVDDRHPGSGEPGRLNPGHRRTRGEQRDVEAGRVGGLGVLDLDLLAAEAQPHPRRSRRSKKPHAGSGKIPLLQEFSHDNAHLPGGAYHSD